MSLIQLLSVGQSLDARRPDAIRYRMRQENLLPDFSDKVGCSPGLVRCSGKGASQENPPTLSEPELTGFAGRGHGSARLQKPFLGRPSQVELNLERIKVVRNDLAEEDLEFVSRSSGESEPTVETGPPLNTHPESTPRFSPVERFLSWWVAARSFFRAVVK